MPLLRAELYHLLQRCSLVPVSLAVPSFSKIRRQPPAALLAIVVPPTTRRKKKKNRLPFGLRLRSLKITMAAEMSEEEEQQALESLQRRLARIELLVGKHESGSHRSGSIHDRLLAVSARVDKVERACPAYKELTAIGKQSNCLMAPSNKCTNLKTCPWIVHSAAKRVRPLQHQQGAAPADVEQKEAVIAASHDQIITMASQLRKIEQLKAHISAPYLSDVKEYTNKLEQLEAVHRQTAAAVGLLHQNLNSMLTRYGSIMTLLNEKFVQFDELLLQLEREHTAKQQLLQQQH
jgi:Dynactin subunit p22